MYNMRNISQLMKGVIVLTIITTASWNSDVSAQSKIEGKLINNETEPLPFVSLVLLSEKDSSFVKGGISDAEGKFVVEGVPNGRYLLIASSIGYKKSTIPNIEISDSKSLKLNSLTLEEEATTLGEVVVEAEKPLFEQQIDRLVMNVQSSITFSGNTVLDILQKSPGIIVDKQNNSINMNGKAGVRIMINEKIIQLPMSTVVQMLNGMSSANIEKIEFITTPPAKYDAEGNAGIIHIVMNERKDLGTNGTFGLTMGYQAAEVFGGNLNLAHRGKKLAYTFNYSALRAHNVHLLDMISDNIQGLTQVATHSYRDNVTTQQNIMGGIEWTISKNTSLDFQFSGYGRKWEMDATTSDINYAKADSTVLTDMNIYEMNLWQSATGGLALRSAFNDENKISISTDYLHYHNNNPSKYDDHVLFVEDQQQANSLINLTKTTPIKMVVGRIDHQFIPSKQFSIESGLKLVASDLNNDVEVSRLQNQDWKTDPRYSSYSSLQEEVAAAYSSITWKLKNDFQFIGGLRYEFTHTAISTPAQKNLVNRRYGYFFPSAFLKKELTQNQDIQFSYSRRITRPTYNDIAPFVFFWGPNTFSAGNTALWPSVSDALQVSYHHKQWITSLQGSHSQREISFFQPEKATESDGIVYRSQNMRYLNTLSLTSSYTLVVAEWWMVQANVSARYQVAETSHLPVNKKLTIYGGSANLTNSITLPRNFSFELSGSYQSKSFFGVSELLPLGSLNAGVQKQFGRGSSLKLSMDDILYTNKWRLETNLPQENLHIRGNYDWHNQYIRLVYTHGFGNNELKSVKFKSGAEEERSRVAN